MLTLFDQVCLIISDTYGTMVYYTTDIFTVHYHANICEVLYFSLGFKPYGSLSPTMSASLRCTPLRYAMVPALNPNPGSKSTTARPSS